MRLLIKNDDGMAMELKEISRLQEGDLIIRTNMVMTKSGKEQIEKELSSKLKRDVTLLDARFGEIVTIPPLK